MKIFKILHGLGLVMVMVGCGLLFLTEQASQINGMILVAVLIGGGLISMSPFPVALFIEWAKKQQS
ncbi:hypothetical protein ACFOD0_15075 [Shewanella intestini]|uniref:Lipoprotein n=1 Tax=Shewanella intestini TaxID=2017544 RepID=A0ABS5I5X9_9GAMM|nr:MULTISPECIES: hypothetical protein [Shewanella]MBR9729401.1 hypothetical protein [Shewanella intestini]MRG37481.1 hypothetical protein [Shewanella sp. XMDDZSB0408]